MPRLDSTTFPQRSPKFGSGTSSSLTTVTNPEDGSMELVSDFNEEVVDATPMDELDFSTLEGINLAESMEEEDVEELGKDILEQLIEDARSNEDHFETLKRGIDILGIKLEENGSMGDWSCGASHPLITENGVKFQAMVVNELDQPDGLVKTRIVGKTNDEQLELMALRKQEAMNHYLTTVVDDAFFLESARCALLTAWMGTGFKYNYWDSATDELCTEFLKVDQVIVNAQAKSLKKSTYTVLKPSSDREIVEKMNSGLFRKIEDFGEDDSSKGSLEASGLTSLDVTKELCDVMGTTFDCERLLAYTFTYLDAKEMMEEYAEGAPEEETEALQDDPLFDATFIGDSENYETESTPDTEDKDEPFYDKKYLPFLVITELYSGEVLGIYANWEPKDSKGIYKPKSYVTDYHFVPGFGFYSLGYIHIIGNFAKMLTSIMRSMVDAGTFANMPAGFKLKGSKLGGTHELAPGVFLDIESTAQDITKTIMPLPFKEPSAVLNAMYTQLEQRGQMFANATEGVVSGASNYGPVGTTMALIEASSKLNTAIIRGFHRSRRRELAIIARLMYENMDEYEYEVDGVPSTAFKTDFDPRIGVYPVSDPNIPSQAQRLALAQQKLDLAQKFPQVHNVREALKDIYRAMGVANVDKLLPPPDEAKPLSPMEDLMAASQSKPIAAFQGQDHQAHITFKQAILQNPQYANNEFMQPVLSALASNIREHMIMDLQEKVGAATTGAATDPKTQAAMQAQVASQLTEMAKTSAQAAANAQDPAFLIAQAQLQKVALDGRKMESKEKIDFASLAIKANELEVEKEKLAQQAKLAQNKITADLVKHDTTSKNNRIDTALQLLGDAAKTDAMNAHAASQDFIKHGVDITKEHIKAKARRTKTPPSTD